MEQQAAVRASAGARTIEKVRDGQMALKERGAPVRTTAGHQHSRRFHRAEQRPRGRLWPTAADRDSKGPACGCATERDGQ
jgi:hypothetical protein